MLSRKETFKAPLLFSAKKRKIDSFQGLSHFKWEDIGDQDVIGHGSFGAVFLTSFQKKETVVVKKLLDSSADFLDAFVKEAKLLSSLSHENIVQFKSVCNNPVAIMLEYVYFDVGIFGGEGKVSSLKDFMASIDEHNCDGIEGSFMKKVASDVARGLSYLHEKNIAHRDLKPSNVLVSNHHYRNETDQDKLANAWHCQPVICKLTDFGESRSLVLQTKTICQSRTKNVDRGTIPFMAPEILEDGEISRVGATVEDLKRVDMWSYGMLLFNLLNPCLHHPFEEALREEKSTGDSKEKIVRFLREGNSLKKTEKYATKCTLEWSDVWKVYQTCAIVKPLDRPDAKTVLGMLNETHGEPADGDER